MHILQYMHFVLVSNLDHIAWNDWTAVNNEM
jgi:hypothetical protein